MWEKENQENQARPKKGFSFSDITNVTAQGLGHQGGNKRPMLDPKTPARRSKSDLAVFDDGAEGAQSNASCPWSVQSAARRPASPPQVRPKSRGGEQDCILGESHQMLGIEEVVEAELPPIQDFADRVSEQDQYWHAFGLDDGPDGFGRPEDLARTLAHGTARACFEAESISDLWDQDLGGCGAESLSSHDLDRMAWPSLSPSPKCKLADRGRETFGLGSSPLLPPLDMEMDIDSGSEADMSR